MNLPAYRRLKGLSQERAATELGLKSKGHLSNLEHGRAAFSLDLALRIEEWSGGQVAAVDLLPPDVAARFRDAVVRAAAGEVA